MWGKIFKFFKWYVLPVIISLIIIIVLIYLKLSKNTITNLIVIVICCNIIYYFSMYMYVFFIKSLVKRKDKNSLYDWLDTLGETDTLLESLFLDIKINKEVLINLEIVYNKINILTGFKKKKIKLLRAYFRAINEEGPLQFYNKTILGIVSPLVVIGISKGVFKLLNTNLILLWGVSLIVSIVGTTILVIFILDHFKNKKRNKIILEILNVCIEELDS